MNNKILKVGCKLSKAVFTELEADLKAEFNARYKHSFYQWSNYFLLLIADLWINLQEDEVKTISYAELKDQVLDSIDYLLEEEGSSG